MEIELKPLRCFVILAEELNFGSAARRLNMAQPTLSAQIRRLELTFGMRLFERTTRHVQLSPAGALILPGAARLVEMQQEVLRTVAGIRDVQRSVLRVGTAFYTGGIRERENLLLGFASDHPEVHVDLNFAMQEDLLPMLEAGEIDLVVLIGQAVSRQHYNYMRAHEPHSEIVFPDDLQRVTLRNEQVELVIPAESPLATVALDAASLAGQTIAMLDPAHGSFIVDPIRAVLENLGAQLIVPAEAHGVALERYTRQKRVPAVTVGWFRSVDRATDDVVYRKIAGLDVITELALVRAPGDLSQAARKMWSYAEKQLLQSSASR